jgi:hypothetical protein
MLMLSIVMLSVERLSVVRLIVMAFHPVKVMLSVIMVTFVYAEFYY